MKRFKGIAPYITAIFVCIFVSFPAVSQSVVLDEAYSAGLVRGNIPSIIHGAAIDVHPPLYYLILKVSRFFGGESLLKYRLVTAGGTYLNLLLLGATLIRKRWGCRVSILYILWFGLTYSTLEKTTFLRMYSWGAFFVTAAAIFLFLYYENGNRRDIFLGTVMTLAAMYTHYYAVISVFLMWVIMLFAIFLKKRKNTKIVLLGGVLVTIGYLPWLKTMLAQSMKVADDYWIASFSWSQWGAVPAALMESSDAPLTGIGAALYGLLIMLFLLAFLRKKWEALLCVAVFFGTMLAGALFSVLVTPIWTSRYMYVGWGLMALFVAVTAGTVTGSFSNISQGLLVLLLVTVGAVSAKVMLADETMSSDAAAWVDFLAENVDENACLIIDNPSEHDAVFKYYLPNAVFMFTEKLLTQNIEDGLETFLAENKGSQIWYVIDYRQQRIGTDKIGACLEELGYTMETVDSFIIKYKSLEVFKVEEKGNEQY